MNDSIGYSGAEFVIFSFTNLMRCLFLLIGYVCKLPLNVLGLHPMADTATLGMTISLGLLMRFWWLAGIKKKLSTPPTTPPTSSPSSTVDMVPSPFQVEGERLARAAQDLAAELRAQIALLQEKNEFLDGA